MYSICACNICNRGIPSTNRNIRILLPRLLQSSYHSFLDIAFNISQQFFRISLFPPIIIIAFVRNKGLSSSLRQWFWNAYGYISIISVLASLQLNIFTTLRWAKRNIISFIAVSSPVSFKLALKYFVFQFTGSSKFHAFLL